MFSTVSRMLQSYTHNNYSAPLKKRRCELVLGLFEGKKRATEKSLIQDRLGCEWALVEAPKMICPHNWQQELDALVWADFN